MKFHSDHCTEKCLPSSPRANLVTEEKATEQYYKKTAEEENWEMSETDRWEIYQTVIDQIKETPRLRTNSAIPREYHEFLHSIYRKSTYDISTPPHSGSPYSVGKRKNTPV